MQKKAQEFSKRNIFLITTATATKISVKMNKKKIRFST